MVVDYVTEGESQQSNLKTFHCRDSNDTETLHFKKDIDRAHTTVPLKIIYEVFAIFSSWYLSCS